MQTRQEILSANPEYSNALHERSKLLRALLEQARPCLPVARARGGQAHLPASPPNEYGGVDSLRTVARFYDLDGIANGGTAHGHHVRIANRIVKSLGLTSTTTPAACFCRPATPCRKCRGLKRHA